MFEEIEGFVIGPITGSKSNIILNSDLLLTEGKLILGG